MRIFVTNIVPREEAMRCRMSVAACNFSWNLAPAVDRVVSILPTFVMEEVSEFPELVYCRWMRKNRFLRPFAPIVEGWKAMTRIPKGSDVWHYNCTQLNAPLMLMLKLFRPSVRQFMIVLDYTPSKKLLPRLFLHLTNKMAGTICLAPSPLFTVKNSVLLPGVVPDDGKRWPGVKEPVKEFLISGVLHDNIAMLPTLLEAFSQLPQLTLNITGTAPDSTLVESYTSRCPNIHYHGMVSYEEYLDILHRCPFQLSTRNPEAPENQCNFPSKIIEALLHNRIIVSTIHYPQLDGIRYFEVAPDVAGMTADLRRIASLPVADLLAAANQAEEVHKRFSTAVWRSTMERIEAAAK